MDLRKHRLIAGLTLLTALATASCATAGEAGKTHEDYVREAVVGVDAKTSASWRELSAEEIVTADQLRKEQLENPKLVIFDARDDKAYFTAHIQGALLPLPLKFYQALRDFRQGIGDQPDQQATLAESTKDYPKDTPVVAYCNEGCKASAGLLLRLKNLGFTDVRAMEEGIGAWQSKGYPVTIGVPKLSPEALTE
jgi:rhodanese-related sulfurtransferase